VGEEADEPGYDDEAEDDESEDLMGVCEVGGL
jgi:hypothetical protein